LYIIVFVVSQPILLRGGLLKIAFLSACDRFRKSRYGLIFSHDCGAGMMLKIYLYKQHSKCPLCEFNKEDKNHALRCTYANVFQLWMTETGGNFSMDKSIDELLNMFLLIITTSFQPLWLLCQFLNKKKCCYQQSLPGFLMTAY
jgi:hypothetical protein